MLFVLFFVLFLLVLATAFFAIEVAPLADRYTTEHADNCACSRCFSEGVGAWASANPPEHGPVLVTYVSERGSRLPVVNLTCFCGVDIPAEQVQDDAQVWISRVNGDSRYGYEAYHAACCKSRRSLV